MDDQDLTITIFGKEQDFTFLPTLLKTFYQVITKFRDLLQLRLVDILEHFELWNPLSLIWNFLQFRLQSILWFVEFVGTEMYIFANDFENVTRFFRDSVLGVIGVLLEWTLWKISNILDSIMGHLNPPI